MAVERYGSKTDVVVKLILVFFISLLSFSIGTFVGKKFSDNQHKIAQLEPDDSAERKAQMSLEERSVASIPESSHDIKPEAALSDDEIAKLAEEFVSDDAGPKMEKLNDKNSGDAVEAKAEHGEESHAVKAEKAEKAEATHAKADGETTKKAIEKVTRKVAAVVEHAKENEAEHHEASAVAEKVAEGKAVSEHSAPAAAAKKENSKATVLPKEVAANAAGKFTVQVAAYAKEEEAQNMSSDLKNKGFSAFYIPAEVKGQTWYRVSVGLFATQKEADAYKKDLLARAKVSSAMVQKLSK